MDVALWRIDGPPRRVASSALPLESRLEDLIEQQPDVLGELLLFIGRQVPTAFGHFVDLLAIDGEGRLHVVELKRDRTPREVVAQALDYGAWIEGLSHEDVLAIFDRYRPDVPFEEAFSERFGVSPPEELNTSHTLTVVASHVDPATARIVEYLARFEIPINVLFFRYFADDTREYIARTWLVDEVTPSESSNAKTRAKREPWNGRDWYVSFGDDSRSWEDARRYGFVSAGGGSWYSRTLRNLPVGARVFVCIPGSSGGYVGVGTVTGPATSFRETVLNIDGERRKMQELDLLGHYVHDLDSDDPDEYVVPVDWIETLPKAEAVWEKGMFANQNSACKLRNRFTMERLAQRFHLDDGDA